MLSLPLCGNGQFRIAHTDFGTVTILDREPGRGGLQVWTPQDGWEDAPYQPGAFTINTGDLLARWSGGRWKSNRHRVLPPQAEAPDEDLISLVYFYEADHDAVIESLQPPIGKPNDYAPAVSAQFLKDALDVITGRLASRAPSCRPRNTSGSMTSGHRKRAACGWISSRRGAGRRRRWWPGRSG